MLGNNSKALLYVSLAILSWATSATAFKIALSYQSPFEMLFIAVLTATAVLGIVVVSGRKYNIIRQASKKTVLKYVLLGLLNPVLYYIVLFEAYDRLPAQIAMPVNYLWPLLLVAMTAIAGRQRIPAIKYICMIISLAGVFVISLGPMQGDMPQFSTAGFILAICSAFLWALYWMAGSMGKSMDDIAGLFISFSTATVCLLIAAPFAGVEYTQTAGVLSSIYVGLFEIAVPFIFFRLALRATKDIALVNQACYLTPFLSLCVIYFVLGERILPSTYIGLALIIAGSAISGYTSHAKKTPAGRHE